jgi:GNAT superfamily N-acetyltransferase
MKIRPLALEDDRTSFSSGDLRLDDYFRRFAAQNQFKHKLGVTYVALEGARVLGFATVSAGGLERDALPAQVRKRLPRYPLPIVRLARLATDVSARGQGVGRELLAAVIALAIRLQDEVGCVGVVVDAKPDAIAFYQKHGFIPLEALEGEASSRPAPSPMFFALSSVNRLV